jgi:glycosylphosphatidylinositol deacylase
MVLRALYAPTVIAVIAVVVLLACFDASSNTPLSLSSQGCRMSWMSPSYVLQQDFNASWTPLAARYSLWLYREHGWEHEVRAQLYITCY